MSVIIAPPVLRWHLNKEEMLPFHFGFHEKKPLSFEHATVHRNSITRLDQHFLLLRQQGDVLIINKAAVEQKYEKEDKLADELTAGGGKGAVEDQGMYEKDLVDQAAKEAPHETLLASNKTFGAENATYDTVDEPTTVAAVDQSILSHLSHDADLSAVKYDGETPGAPSPAAAKSAAHADFSSAALPPPKDDILNLPAKDETIDLSRSELVVNSRGVPVVIPVAEPLDPTTLEAVKQADHPDVVDREEQEEAERVAAQGALASGSLAPIEDKLLASALKSHEVPETETAVVQMPVAEPVGTVTTTLHAPHPSLDDSQLAAALGSETLASEEDAAAPTASLDELRQQHEDEAAAAKAETERLDSEDISAEERENAEIALMSRTKRLAALHERIIRHQTLDAQGPDITAIRKSPQLPPTASSSRIMEIQQLHLQQAAESGVTHTALEKTDQSAPVKTSRTKELARLHEQKIKEEAEAKKQQDELFAGKSKASPTAGGKSRRNNKKR